MLLREFIKHFFTAKTLHGTHSPFIYDLYKSVFSKDEDHEVYSEIEKLRSHLKRDNSMIEFKDFGAKGSKEGLMRKVKTNTIAKTSLKPKKWGRAFHRLISYLNVKEVIELGTSLGITTAYLASSNKNVKVTSFEGSENVLNKARQVWEKLGLVNIRPILGNIDSSLPKHLASLTKVELVFVDANHQKEATKSYFDLLVKYCNSDSVLIFDDIYWSKGMKEAWDYIKQHPETCQTIDLYEIGMVFFRKNQVKEHFRLKY